MIVFGATGFTGRRVANEVARYSKSATVGKWAIAGRNRDRLEAIAREIGGGVACVVADVGDDSSLAAMAGRCRVLLNCVGPYRHYGEQVVRAAVDAGCHYVDVCGEPQFLEEMAFTYDARAIVSGSYVVGACGFDSVPSDLGVEFARKSMRNGRLCAAAGYLNVEAGPKGAAIHFATYESAVYGIADVKQLRLLRSKFNFKRLPVEGPRQRVVSGAHYRTEHRGCAAPFPVTYTRNALSFPCSTRCTS